MLVGALTAGAFADRIGRKKLMVACVTLFSPASGVCATADGITVFGLGRTLAGVGLGGLLPTAISMVSDYAPRGRGAIVIGMLMTAHHAGGILSAYVAKWPVEPVGRRAAFWVCVLPLLLYWPASFGGLLLVYGVATWLPTLMRSEGYNLGSALTFVVLFNLGGIVGMLVAGRAADRFGAPRISAIWFALTAAGVFLLSVHMPLGVTMLVVFLTGVFLNSAQAMIYATVSIRSTPDNRATAVGWTSGMGRFGAVFGPWLGGQLLAANHGDRGFTAFALAGVSSMVFIGIAALRSSKAAGQGSMQEELVTAH